MRGCSILVPSQLKFLCVATRVEGIDVGEVIDLVTVGFQKNLIARYASGGQACSSYCIAQQYRIDMATPQGAAFFLRAKSSRLLNLG